MRRLHDHSKALEAMQMTKRTAEAKLVWVSAG